MSWPLTPDGERYLFEGIIEIAVHPETGASILMLRPQGGMGVGIPPIAQGAPGKHAAIDTTINVTELEAGDPTALSWSWTELIPPDDDTPGLYRLNAVTRKGAKGDDGESVWDPTDLTPSPVAGTIPVVNAEADGFELAAPKVPEVFYPGSISNTGSGNNNSTLCPISIPSRPYARRVRANGFTVVSGEGADVRVNLLARLNSESAGNIVGRCIGIAQTERLTFSPGKPIESGTVADTYDVIAAGATATVYIRCEKTAGSTTYLTSASTSQFSVETLPL